jgi:hypothetical protein
MGITVGGTRLARDESAERRRVTIALSELAFESLTGGNSDVDSSLRMENALLCYLEDSDSGRPAWAYPEFLRGSEMRKDVEVEFTVAENLWRDFEEAAVGQGVTVEQLAEHAAFYFAAELDAGRVTQRILDDLDADGSG